MAKQFDSDIIVEGNVSVIDDSYGIGWNGSLEVPTKNAIYDGFLDKTSLAGVTLSRQASAGASGLAGVNINKALGIGNAHGISFSYDNSILWDFGMDFDNEDYVLAFNHTADGGFGTGDIIRISPNNKINFGGIIGSPSTNAYQWTFANVSTDTNLKGLYVNMDNTSKVGLETNGKISADNTITSGNSVISRYFNNSTTAQWVHNDFLADATNNGVLMSDTGALTYGGISHRFNNGNVGILKAPTEALDVQGNILASGNITATTNIVGTTGAYGGNGVIKEYFGNTTWAQFVNDQHLSDATNFGVMHNDDGSMVYGATSHAFSGGNISAPNLSGTNTGNQTLSNTSDATSHTVTLSATGGSVQLIEGSNITLTTGGTGSDGTVTIASSAGGGNVTKVGTPVNNQVGVWTGDGTLEGESFFTWSGGATGTLNVGAQSSILSRFISLGSPNQYYGSLTMYGNPTVNGGRITIFNSADSQSVFNSYEIKSVNGNLEITAGLSAFRYYQISDYWEFERNLNLTSGNNFRINNTEILSDTALSSDVQVGVNSLNSGTGASSSTFWRGDGTWAAGIGDMLLGTEQTVTANKTFNHSTFRLRNGSNTFSYTFFGGAIAADTIVSLPALGGNDTLAFETHPATLANKTLTSPVLNGTVSGTAIASTSSPSTLVFRNGSSNAIINNLTRGYTTTVTAAGTTTLTVGSSFLQFFTGSTTQTVDLPVTSSLTLGHQFYIRNNSTGAVTIRSSGGNTVMVLAPNTRCHVTCILTSGTTAASWSTWYSGVNIASTKVATISNSLTFAGTDGTTMTFPSTSGNVATLAATQTLTNKTIPVSSNTISGLRDKCGITVESPTNSEDISLINIDRAATITRMVAVVRGTTPSVTWTVRKGSDRSATGTEVVTSGTTTTSQTTGSVVTSFNSATLAANDFVWLETTAASGTIAEFSLTIHYNYN